MVNKERLQKYLIFKNGKKPPTSEGIYPVYGGNGIFSYTNDYNNVNSIIIGRVGAYCGSVNYYKEKSWVSDNAISAQLVDDSMNIEYFYYLMKSLNLNNKRIGTSQPLLTQDILKNIEIEILSNLNQNKIASILSNFDRKIEVNNKIIDNLEQRSTNYFQILVY